jgi:hypothetical protein
MAKARDTPQPKIGAGHAAAMLRQGIAELRGAFYNDYSNVAQPPQYGLYGTRTPGEVADAREPKERNADEEPKSILGDSLRQAEALDEERKKTKELEKELER